MLILPFDELNTLYNELKIDEGKKLKVYKDTKNIKTVGIGFNIEAHDSTPIIGRKLYKIGQTITETECQLLFNYSLKHVALIPLDQNLPVLTKQLDSVRLRALINLCFNMGWVGLSKFKNTLSHLQSKNYSQAARNLEDSLWYSQVKTRGPRIVYMIEHGQPHPYYKKPN